MTSNRTLLAEFQASLLEDRQDEFKALVEEDKLMAKVSLQAVVDAADIQQHASLLWEWCFGETPRFRYLTFTRKSKQPGKTSI